MEELDVGTPKQLYLDDNIKKLLISFLPPCFQGTSIIRFKSEKLKSNFVLLKSWAFETSINLIMHNIPSYKSLYETLRVRLHIFILLKIRVHRYVSDTTHLTSLYSTPTLLF